MTGESTNMESGAEANLDNDEISLLDLAIIVAKHKKMVLGLTAVAAAVAAAVSLAMSNVYTATARILPPIQSQSTASAILAQLGGVASAFTGTPGIKNPNDVYVGMLKSRTVADGLIQRFDLASRYETKFSSDARAVLEKNTAITAGKDGLITIEFDDKDPKFAAEVANAYVDEVKKLMRVLAVTEASQRRLFFENQLQHAQENLGRAEAAARLAMERGGLTNVETQGRTLLETTARLRGQISAKEVQITAMRAFAAGNNPDLIRAQQELAAMRGELAKIEGVTGGGDDGTSRPGRGFGNLKLVRDVKYYETINELIAKQYELAKIDEAKDMAVIQVMDPAIPPDRKTRPKRALMVVLATIAGGLLGVVSAFVSEGLEKARANRDTAARLQTIRRLLSWRTS